VRLKDKVAVVTGGARGIGREICSTFLKEGAVVYIFDVDREQGNKTLREFESTHGKDRVNFTEVDITNEKNVENSIENITAVEEGIDILVNNAGITRDSLILRMSLDEWQKVIDINLTGAFICSKYVVKKMVKKRSGKIINISSIVGVHGNAGQSNYSSSKAGIIGLTKTLARELAGRNILVNAIAPGYIETEMTEKLSDKVKEKLMEQIPIKRLGSVKDVANTVLFLASDDSNYITGTVVSLDGGMGI
jgi:3-oxoacyl-[acyl-carrier protein] reductase